MRIETTSVLTPENASQQERLRDDADEGRRLHLLHVEPDDVFECVLSELRVLSGPVILLLPEQGQVLSDPAQFEYVRQVRPPDRVALVIPPGRMGTVARLAHQHGFLFAVSPEKAARLLLSPEQTSEEIDQHTSSPFSPPAATPWHETEGGSLEDEMGGLERRGSGAFSTVPSAGWGPQEASPASVPVSRSRTSRRPPVQRLLLLATILLLLVGASAGLLLALFSPQPGLTTVRTTATPTVVTVGQVSFENSGQLNPTSSRGINDVITVSLHNLIPPTAGQREDAWLLPDRADDSTRPLLLGTLVLRQGKAQLTYRQPAHENLLARYSRFEITAQPSGEEPTTPPLDPGAVRAEGFIPDTPTPGDEQRYSLLDHIRHLLATDPTLQQLGLPGGLDIWLDRNAEKILEWSSAARDEQGPEAADAIHLQLVRILEYLDGVGSVFASGDLPPGSPLLVDPTQGRIGLLELNPTQLLPGYLTHVDIHLQGLIHAPGHTQAQQTLAIKLDRALKTDTALLQHVRQNAVTLVHLDPAQLLSPSALSLLDEMVTDANQAYTGQLDPTTGGNINGIAWIHNELQGVAIMPVTTPTPENAQAR